MIIYICLLVAFVVGFIATMKYVEDIAPALLLSIFCCTSFMITLGMSCERTATSSLEVLKIKDKAILNNGICLQVETYSNPLIFKSYNSVSILVNEEKIEKVTTYNIWGNSINSYFQFNGTILE